MKKLEGDEEWEKKRNKTYFVYLLQSVFIGLDLTIIQATLLDYLDKGVRPESPALWYDLINGIVYFCPISCGFFVAQCTDETKNVRQCMILLNGLVFTGTILYMLPFSPFCVFAGRFLQGFNFILRSVIYAEFNRIFHEEEVHKTIPAFLTGISVGYLLGPLSNMMFVNTDFWIGKLHIVYGNAAAFPLLVLSASQIILLTSVTYNVSKEHDIKEEMEVKEFNWQDREEETNSFFDLLKSIFHCKEYVLLLIMSLHSGAGITVYPRVLPLVVQKLQFTDQVLNICFFGIGLLGTIIALLCSRLHLKSTHVLACGFTSLVSFAVTMVAIFIPSRNQSHWSDTGNYIFLGISVLTWSLFNATSKTFLILTCNKFVLSSNQTFGETVRAGITMLGRLLAAFGSTFAFNNLLVFTITNFVLSVLFFGMMIWMRKGLSEPVACF